MKLMVKGYTSKIVTRLSEFGIECEIINNPDIGDRSLKHIRSWRQRTKEFDRIVDNFKPDMVISDPGDFGAHVLRRKIPLIVYLRGNIWQEASAKRKIERFSYLQRFTSNRFAKTSEQCMNNSSAILTVSKHLEGIVRNKYPNKPVYTLHMGTDPLVWQPQSGMTLKHPCVGLVQKATVWDKVKEMLVLKQVLGKLPDVTFYWGGFGRYTEAILKKLEKYPNFQYLGKLEHPDKVRQFLTEIDIYILLAGLDMAPESLREAMLIGKPVIATNTGGIPEIISDPRAGILVSEGAYDKIVEKILCVLKDQKKSCNMGSYGKSLIERKWSLDATAKKLMKILNEIYLQ